MDSTVSRLSKRVTANPASAGGAGISSEYLQRLEQGRDRHPSAEVLDSIARALRMDAKATNHLHKLAHSASRPHRAPASEVEYGEVDVWLCVRSYSCWQEPTRDMPDLVTRRALDPSQGWYFRRAEMGSVRGSACWRWRRRRDSFVGINE